MKHYVFLINLLMVFSCFISCSSYDDSDIKSQIQSLDSRVTDLENKVVQINKNISSYLTIVEALESGDRILSVEQFTDDTGSGYIITFSKTGTIKVYHGNDGQSGSPGHTPIIGVKQFTDGIYYWTVDGDFLLNDKGEKIAATSQNSTPLVQLSTDGKHYEISFDNGVTWVTVGDILGSESVNAIFEDVEDGADFVTFYLTEGGTIVIPKVQLFALNISYSTIGTSAGDLVEIPYSITAADEETVVDGIGSNGYKVSVIQLTKDNGIIVVEAPNPLVEGKAIILAVNGKGTTSGKILSFEQGNLVLITEGGTIGADGGNLTIQIKTNLSYYVEIPGDATWIKLVETKALRDEFLTFSIEKNTGIERTATIQLVDDYDEVLQSFTIIQTAGSSGGSTNSGYYNNIDDWEYENPITF